MLIDFLNFAQVSFRNGECTSFYFIDGKLGTDVFKGLATYVFTMHYILPAVLFVIFLCFFLFGLLLLLLFYFGILDILSFSGTHK